MAAAGKTAPEIVAACEELAPCVDASFIIDSLEFLYKGGRCSALAAFGANMLSLKPCIVVKSGKMGVGKKYRGKFGAVLPKYVADRLGDASDVIKNHIFVTHAGCEPAIINACVEQVKAVAPRGRGTYHPRGLYHLFPLRPQYPRRALHPHRPHLQGINERTPSRDGRKLCST